MKLTMLTFLFISLTWMGCNDNASDKTNTNAVQADIISDTTEFDLASIQTISSDSLKKLYRYFKNDFKKGDSIITKFSRKDLIDVLSMMSVDTVKLVVGLYDDGQKKGKPMIFLRIPTYNVGKTAITGYIYQEGSLCPPPDICSIDN